jgi:HEAT repeat protein
VNLLTNEDILQKNIRLLQAKDKAVRQEAASALGRLMDSKAIKPLSQLLSKEQVLEVRRAAVLSLSLLGDKSVLPLLLEILQKDSDPETRRNAAGGLRFFRDSINSKELYELLLSEKDPTIRKVLASTLIFLNDPNILLQAIDSFNAVEDDEIQACLLELIGSYDDDRTKETLIACLEPSTEEELRLIATRAMGKLDDVAFIPYLYKVYKNDPSEDVQECAHDILDELSIVLNFDSIEQMVFEFQEDKEDSTNSKLKK